MWISKWSGLHQSSLGGELTQQAIHFTCLQCFCMTHFWQDTNTRFCKQCFSCTWWSNHNQIMSSCSSNFNGSFCLKLSLDKSKVKRITDWCFLIRINLFKRSIRFRMITKMGDFGEVIKCIYFKPLNQRRFGSVNGRNNQSR